MAKKILFVGASLGGGGSERVMTIIANALFLQGNDVKIIRLFDNKVDYKIEDGIQTEYIGNDISNPYTKKIKLVKSLRKKINNYKPDTIISFLTTCNVISILAAMGKNINVIVSERNDPNNNVKTNFAAKVRNIIYSFADCLVCQTQDAINYFPKKIQKKSVVIPNPINESLPNVYLGQRKKNIVMVCRLNKQKNIPMALYSFEEFYKDYPDWTLDIYGDGNEKENLLRLAQQLESKNNIKFHGFTKNVIDKISSCGIYLSTSDYEGISNSMLEAIAMGIPSVVTDCPIGGAKMIIENGVNGIMIPVNKTDECIKALKSLASGTQILAPSEKTAFELREKYSVNKILNYWYDLI